MELIIENEQDKIEITEDIEALISDVIQKTLEYESFGHDCIVSVTIVDNDKIHSLNKEFRNIDRPTDVLSFPVLEFENGKIVDNCGDYFEGKLILGDVILSGEKALEQSREYGHSFERETGFLVCHSILHLLGYDHETEPEREVMRQKEEAVLEILNLTR